MKGIILSGGYGTRLKPLTLSISKQVLPVYDKPMVYYPLSTLINAGIKDIILISDPISINTFKKLLKDGSQLGVSIEYVEQNEPLGLAHSFIITEHLIKGESVCLILGDNIFHGYEETISDCIMANINGCTLFGYNVSNPNSYGVAVLDRHNRIIGIEEKPKLPKSNVAITGLYVYDETIAEKAKSIYPSYRGELEITDINNLYINENKAKLFRLPNGVAWLDMGSPDGLLQASNYVQTIQKRQGIQIGCPEISAFKQGFIKEDQLCKLSGEYENTDYGRYLLKYANKNMQ